jgi:tRNA(Ile)-lysidine synthase
MLSKFQSALAKLLDPNEKLLVGVSGGADSVALLDALVRGGWQPHVCHLNHQLRGAESDADAEFVRELARNYGLPCTIESRKVAAGEDAARQARHEFFASVAARTALPTLALAHTADDQVETFLMRLIRGAGIDGLTGMLPERRIGSLRVLRPMLSVWREEVLKYLDARGLKWREDASNRDLKFLRNRIRHELLPLLERDYNPGIRDALWRTAEIVRAEVEGDPVAAERRAIRQLSFEQVEALRKLAKREPRERVTGRWLVGADGETTIKELNICFDCRPERREGSPRQRTQAPRSAGNDSDQEERFDADALGAQPFVRMWEDGDRFQPLGMSETKKLQDFFVDEKIPRRQRGRIPLLCATDGRIAWIVGHRIAEPFKVTAQTRRVLRISVTLAEG